MGCFEWRPLDDPSKGSVGYFHVEVQPGDTSQIGALLRGTAELKRTARERKASVRQRKSFRMQTWQQHAKEVGCLTEKSFHRT